MQSPDRRRRAGPPGADRLDRAALERAEPVLRRRSGRGAQPGHRPPHWGRRPAPGRRRNGVVNNAACGGLSPGWARPSAGARDSASDVRFRSPARRHAPLWPMRSEPPRRAPAAPRAGAPSAARAAPASPPGRCRASRPCRRRPARRAPRARARVGDPLDEVAVALAMRSSTSSSESGSLEEGDVAGRVGEVADAALEPKGSSSTRMFSRLSSKRSRTWRMRAAQPTSFRASSAPDDPELALLFEALPDHQPVALLEDVERHRLAGSAARAPGGTARKALDGVGHRPQASARSVQDLARTSRKSRRADALQMSIEATNGLPEGADHSVSLELDAG